MAGTWAQSRARCRVDNHFHYQTRWVGVVKRIVPQLTPSWQSKAGGRQAQPAIHCTLYPQNLWISLWTVRIFHLARPENAGKDRMR